MTDPIFILAPPYTMGDRVCAMLGEHEALFSLPDVNLFAADTLMELGSSWYRQNPRLQKGLLYATAELGFEGHESAQLNEAKGWLRFNLNTPTLQIFQQLQAWAAPRVLLDKSVLNLSPLSLQRIASTFPAARYLHLLQSPWRAGYLAERQSDSIEERVWLRPNLAILEFLETIDDARQLEIRVEDLFADPELYLMQILEWLGLDADTDAIKKMQSPDLSVLEKVAMEPIEWQAVGSAEIHEDPVTGSSLELEICHFARLFGYT